MGILQLPAPLAAQTGIFPATKKMVTTDSLATVTTAGYLNSVNLESYPIQSTDILEVLYAFDPQTNSGSYGIFTVAISNGVITLSQWVDSANVLLPVVDKHLAAFNGTTGQIFDNGYVPSDTSKTIVVMAGSAVQSGYFSKFVDTSGTVDDTAGTGINAGNIQAGLSGTAGTLASFPSTASKGSLKVVAVANTGDTVTTISNVAMGQASVVSIPDPGVATANFAVAPAALVNNNLVKANGTAGLLADAGFAASAVVLTSGTNTMQAGSSIVLAKSTGTEAANAVTVSAQAGVITTSSLSTAGGASYAITWTNTFISSSSAILVSCMGGTNTTKNFSVEVTAGSGTATITIYNNTAATGLNGTIILSFMVA